MNTRFLLAIGALGCASCATDLMNGSAADPGADSEPNDGPGDGKADDPDPDPGVAGPGAGAQVTFAATAQKGGFWELSDGELYSAFTTSTESLTYGRTRHNFELALVAPDATDADDAAIVSSAGSCVDEGNNYQCLGGLLDPSTQKGTTLTTSDNRLLLMSNAFVNGTQHPQLRLLDPTAATPPLVLANFDTVPSSSGNPAQFRLVRLPTGELLVSTSAMYGEIRKSFVLAETGAVLAEIDGFAIGYRTSPLEIAVLRHPANFTHEYVWWDRETDQTSPAGTIVVTNNSKTFNYDRPVITTDGELVLWPRDGAENRLVRFARDGSQISDATMPSGTSINAIAPSGDLVLIKNVNVTPGWDWSVVLARRDGTERLLYDRNALTTDAGWNITWNYTANSPNLNDIEPMFDAVGNLYLSIVKSASNTYQTYLLGFDRDGEKQFGLVFDKVYSSPACMAHSVLASGRLAVSCPGRVNNDLYLVTD